MKKKVILVFGSVHIDILANYDENTKGDIYKEGGIFIGIGGVGFNVAANLVYHDYNAKLFTVIKSHLYSGLLIEEALKSRNMSTQYLHKNKTIDFNSEIGFVGINNNKGDLDSGVTSTYIDIYEFDRTKLERAIRNSDIIVIDCNLNHIQINQTIDFCHLYNKPLFVCSVSENKVERALKYDGEKSIWYKVFCLNSSEADKVLFSQNTTWEVLSKNPKDLCEYFHSENVLITNGDKGYSVFTINGDKHSYGCHKITPIVSKVGAGDALFSATIAHYVDFKDFNWLKCNDLINLYLRKVLITRNANPEFNIVSESPKKKSSKSQIEQKNKLNQAVDYLEDIKRFLGKSNEIQADNRNAIEEIVNDIKNQLIQNGKIDKRSFRSLVTDTSNYASISSLVISLGQCLKIIS